MKYAMKCSGLWMCDECVIAVNDISKLSWMNVWLLPWVLNELVTRSKFVYHHQSRSYFFTVSRGQLFGIGQCNLLAVDAVRAPSMVVCGEARVCFGGVMIITRVHSTLTVCLLFVFVASSARGAHLAIIFSLLISDMRPGWTYPGVHILLY